MFRAFWSKSDKHAAKPTVGDAVRDLRGQLVSTLASKDFEGAVSLLEQLEEREPGTPRWPHKRGDVLLLQRQTDRAFAAYAKAVRLYTDMGKTNLAEAMAKTALNACPASARVLKDLDLPTQEAFLRSSSNVPGSMVIDFDLQHAAASM